MELRKAKPVELKKIVKIMIESGEWDGWKLSYLHENWKIAMNHLKKVIENEELGSFYVINHKNRIVGAVPLVRIGVKSLFFTCAGLIKKYEKEAMELIERDLLEILPSQYKILMNYGRPTSNGAVPKFLEEEFGIKNNMMMFKRYDELPEFLKQSIKLSPPYFYVEKIVKKEGTLPQKFLPPEVYWKKIEKLINSEFVEAFDLKERTKIEKIYKEYKMNCKVRVVGSGSSLTLFINYPFGLTPSGYLNAVYFLGKNIEDRRIKEAESYYFSVHRRLLGFIKEDYYHLFKKKDFTIIKLLQQIFYNIPENRKWRREMF
ncbi:MAG: hypothetical protein QXS37_02430 [Candidatus Aenigmatarchaeota archaeon]